MSICCCLYFICYLMFMHTLFFCILFCSFCGSCFSERCRCVPHCLISSFCTSSWASSWAPCTWLPSLYHLGSDALCPAALYRDTSLFHPSITLCQARVLWLSLLDVDASHAQPDLMTSGLLCSGKKRGEKKKEEGTL